MSIRSLIIAPLAVVTIVAAFVTFVWQPWQVEFLCELDMPTTPAAVYTPESHAVIQHTVHNRGNTNCNNEAGLGFAAERDGWIYFVYLHIAGEDPYATAYCPSVSIVRANDATDEWVVLATFANFGHISSINVMDYDVFFMFGCSMGSWLYSVDRNDFQLTRLSEDIWGPVHVVDEWVIFKSPFWGRNKMHITGGDHITLFETRSFCAVIHDNWIIHTVTTDDGDTRVTQLYKTALDGSETVRISDINVLPLFLVVQDDWLFFGCAYEPPARIVKKMRLDGSDVQVFRDDFSVVAAIMVMGSADGWIYYSVAMLDYFSLYRVRTDRSGEMHVGDFPQTTEVLNILGNWIYATTMHQGETGYVISMFRMCRSGSGHYEVIF